MGETRAESGFYWKRRMFSSSDTQLLRNRVPQSSSVSVPKALSWHVYLHLIADTSGRWSALWQLGEVVTLAAEEWLWCKFTGPFTGRAGIWRLLACATTTAAYKLSAYKADICFGIKLYWKLTSTLYAALNSYSPWKKSLVFQCRFEFFFICESPKRFPAEV